jgi:hypothetical protein
MAAAVQQDRLDATRHMVTVPLTAREPETIEKVQLESPYFATAPAAQFGQQLPAGGRIDFPVPYGAARCEAKEGPGTAVVTIRSSSGATREVRLRADAGALQTVWRAECEDRAFAEAVTVSWAGPWQRRPARTGEAQRLAGSLHLTLADRTARATVSALKGSVLYDISRQASGPVRLDSAHPSADVPIEIGVRLCFKHGLTEAKKVFVFTMHAQLNGAPEHPRTLTPPAAVQGKIASLLVTCPDEE